MEPFGYFKAEPFGWTDCAETDEGAQPLFDQAAIDEIAKQRDELLAALESVSMRLRKAGASIPAPENKGTIESAMATGLSIALLLVEDAIASVKEKRNEHH